MVKYQATHSLPFSPFWPQDFYKWKASLHAQLHNAMSTAHPLRTRQTTGGQIRLGQNFDTKQGLLHDSFRYRASKDYNNIPLTMRSIRYLPSFKKKLKQWIRLNIPID